MLCLPDKSDPISRIEILFTISIVKAAMLAAWGAGVTTSEASRRRTGLYRPDIIEDCS